MIYIIERPFKSKLLAISLTTVNNWTASKFKYSIFGIHVLAHYIYPCRQLKPVHKILVKLMYN